MDTDHSPKDELSEFGYDDMDQIYFEVDENKTVVMNHEDDTAKLEVFIDGNSVDSREFTKDNLHEMDNIINGLVK